MLKTALKPRWILALVLAMAVAAVFVLLSQWQLSSSRSSPPPPPSSTEQVQPLTAVFQPGTPMMAATADQMVAVEGQFRQDDQVLVSNRLRNGETGYWVVTAFQVDGVEPAVVVPVVRGWVGQVQDAGSAPAGPVTVTGRLLPTEAPVAERPVEGIVASLSVAELINIWDVPSYSGFIAAFEVADAAGTPVGAGSVTAASSPALLPVEVGPQPQEVPINWLNIFYAVEWVVFAGFAFFLWWRLVSDDYRRTLEEAEEAEEAEDSENGDQTDHDQTDHDQTDHEQSEVHR